MKAIDKTAVPATLALAKPPKGYRQILKREQGRVTTGHLLDTRSVKINGIGPAIGKHGALSGLDGVSTGGALSLPGRSIVFVVADRAGNADCR